MKTIVLTDSEAAELRGLIRDNMYNTGKMSYGVLAKVRESLNQSNDGFTKESFSELPVADFKTIDETMKYALDFIVAQNKYNDVKNITASAICDYLLAQRGFKTRKA